MLLIPFWNDTASRFHLLIRTTIKCICSSTCIFVSCLPWGQDSITRYSVKASWTEAVFEPAQTVRRSDLPSCNTTYKRARHNHKILLMETAINIVAEQTIWKTKKSSKMDQSSKSCRKERKVWDKQTYWSSIPKGKPKLTDKLQRNQNHSYSFLKELNTWSSKSPVLSTRRLATRVLSTGGKSLVV
jgi:hypothetical protein